MPFLLSKSPSSVVVAVVLAAVALFGVGALMSLFSGKNAILSGLRMLAIGAVAGGVTYSLGRLFGVALG
jgi:VIT1/CCC1 family predicted Fe2+/Mn2+ transporter